MRLCNRCGEHKTPDQFSKDPKGRDGLRGICRECEGVARRQRYSAEGQRDRLLRQRYGISAADYDRMFEEQFGCCAICGKAAEGKPLVVDHCHDSLDVRGLLCSQCNTLLGMAQDDVAVLIRAAQYLRKAGK